MPEEEAKDETTEQSKDEGKKKKLPLKTILVVLGLLIGEAVVVVGVVSTLGGPSEVQGEGVEIVEDDGTNQLQEVLIVNDRFPNHQTGRVWLWELELQIKVKAKNKEKIETMLEERAAEIKTGVSQIMRTAHHNHLKEPNLDTITRQLTDYLERTFGRDGDGEERIVNVLIPKCVGFPADY